MLFVVTALIDMTGGIEETFQLKDIEKHAFFDKLGNALAHDAMMVSHGFKNFSHVAEITVNLIFKGCSISADPNVREARLANGLIKGHAYAITAVVTLNVGGRTVRLIRIRNPW